MRNGGTAATDDTQEIELQHAPPDLIVGVFESAMLGVTTSHVDQDVDLTKLAAGQVDRMLDGGRVGHIDGHCQVRTDVVAGQIVPDDLRVGQVEIGHGNQSALRGEAHGTRPADPMSASGHDGAGSDKPSGRAPHA
jgi:hypothetical protein